MNNNGTGRLLKIFISAFITAAALLMTSCPPQVTPSLVSMASDILPPTITNISPKGGSNYYSSVTISGNIYDDVLESGDESGRIASISYIIANDEQRRGKIDIGPDDIPVKDTSFGNEDITFDLITGEFSFTFSTISPTFLRDMISISITAVDNNDNKIVEQLNLYESNGPYVEFDFFKSGDYSDASRITSLSGDRVYLGGYVHNSEYEQDDDSEIVELTWTVVGTSLGATLDITEDSDDWNAETGVFEITNAFEDIEFFRFDPVKSFFYTETSIDVEEGSKNFQVTAVDIYGHETTAELLLTPPASLMLSTPTSSRSYFSKNPDLSPSSGISDARTITLSSKITDPNDGILTWEQIASIVCTFSSTAQETSPSQVDVYSYGTEEDFNSFFHMSTDPGAFEFSFTTNDWPGTPTAADDGGTLINLNGSIYAKITVEDEKGKTKNKSILIEQDNSSPQVTGHSIVTSGGTAYSGKTYLTRGDIINLNITTSDSGAGVDTLSSTINGHSETPTLLSTNSYSSTHEIPAGEESAAAGDSVQYTINVWDSAGNKSAPTVATDSTSIFYGPYIANGGYTAPSIINTNSISGWARAVPTSTRDTLTVNFTSNRVLTGKPVITIANRTVDANNVTYTASTGACSAFLQMNGTDEGLADTDNIPFTAQFTDITTENTYTQTGDTGVQYDKTAPAQPGKPTHVGVTNAGYINAANTSTGSITFRVTGLSAGTTTLFAKGTSIATTTDTGTADITVTRANAATLRTALGGQGETTINARTVDQAGNIGAYSEDFTPVVDTVFNTCIASDDPDKNYDGADSKTIKFNQDAGAGVSVVDSLSGINNASWTVSTTSGDGTCNYSTNASYALIIDSFTPGGSTTADGDYHAVLSATDNAGNPASDSFDFTLDADVLEASFSGITTEYVNANAIPLTSTYSGAESGVPSFSWSATTEPSAGAAVFGNAAAQNTSVTPNVDGPYVIRLIVTDQLGRPVTALSGDYDFAREIAPPAWTAATISANKSFGNINSSSSDTAFTAYATDAASGVEVFTWTIDRPVSADTTQVDTIGTPTSNSTESSTLTFASIANDGDGAYSATCVVTDDAENSSTVNNPTVTFTWDASAPAVTGITFVKSDTTYPYVKEGDVISLTFTATDLTGIATNEVIKIFDQTLTSSDITNATEYNITYPIPADISDSAAGTSFGYSISCSDTLGNGPDVKTPDSVDELYFYSPYINTSSSYFYSSINVTSNNANGSRAKIGDTITVTFTGVRDLLSDPVVSIGGEVGTDSGTGESFSYDPSTKICEANITITAVSSLAESTIPVIITETDKANNPQGTYTYTSTGITFDKTPPGTPTAISTDSGGAYINRTDDVSDDKAQITVEYPSTDVSSVRIRFNSETTYYENNTDTTSPTVIEVPVANLPSGSGNIIHAYTVDDAGNESAEFDSSAYTVDTELPTAPTDVTPTTGDAYINATEYNPTTGFITVTVSYGPSNSSDIIYLNYNGNTVSGAYNNSTKTTDFDIPHSNLNTGSNVLTAYTKDTAGNISTSNPDLTLTLDTAAPTANLPYTEGTGSYNATITPYNVSDNIDDAGVLTYSWTYDTTNLTVEDATAQELVITEYVSGTYDIELTITDLAGNFSSPTASCTFEAFSNWNRALGTSTPTLRSSAYGGSSGSSGSARTAGRINTGSFESTTVTAPAASKPAVTTSYSRSTSGYSGSLYTSSQSSTKSSDIETDNSSASNVTPVEAEPVTTEVAESVVSAEPADIPAAGSGGGKTVIKPAGFKASSAAVASNTAAEPFTETVPDSNAGRFIWLLLLIPAAGAIILLKKRRQ